MIGGPISLKIYISIIDNAALKQYNIGGSHDPVFGAGCNSRPAVKSASRFSGMNRRNSGTDSTVWMEEDDAIKAPVQKMSTPRD